MFFVAHFVFGDAAVCFLKAEVVYFHFSRVELERGYDVAVGAGAFPGGGPRALGADFVVGASRPLGREHHFFHHLPDDSVGENHRRSAVFEGEVEAEGHEVGHFLNGGRGEDDKVVIAVASAFCGLEIVALGGLDCAESGAAAHTVEDERRELGGGKVGYAFLFERNAGR